MTVILFTYFEVQWYVLVLSVLILIVFATYISDSSLLVDTKAVRRVYAVVQLNNRNEF